VTGQPVPARDVRRGDVLAHDGRQIEVSAAPCGAWYREHGQPVAGLAIECRAGSARWFLYRRGGELLCRVREGGQ
jgi:hypothetical protein